MAWTNSRMFREWPKMTDQVAGTGFTGLDSDIVNAALYNNTTTPDKDAAVGLTGYNAATSQWVTANEVTDVTNWPAKGRTLASKTFTTPATGVYRFDAADTAGGGSLTIANAFGCLILDDSITAGTVADQGVCYNYFGGGQSVTGGTFTIVWSANGIFEVTT